MRLLWAKALDDYRTAIVIEDGYGELLGGVVIMRELAIKYGYPRDFTRSTLDLKFVWEWWRYVKTPEDFAESKEWEHREVAAPMKQSSIKND